MKQRAPYYLEVFDDEDASPYGTLNNVDSLVGAALQFIGWDENGTVVWDTDHPTSVPASISITSQTAKTYAAAVGPLPADTSTSPPANKVYTWKVRRTNPGQRAVLVWGFLTVTPSPPNND